MTIVSFLIVFCTYTINKNFIHYHSLENIFNKIEECDVYMSYESNSTADISDPRLSLNITSKLVSLESKSIRNNWTVTDLKSVYALLEDNISLLVAIKATISIGDYVVKNQDLPFTSNPVKSKESLIKFVLEHVDGDSHNIFFFRRYINSKQWVLEVPHKEVSICHCIWYKNSPSKRFLLNLAFLPGLGVLLSGLLFLIIRHYRKQRHVGPEITVVAEMDLHSCPPINQQLRERTQLN